jgi:hypothetical protein
MYITAQRVAAKDGNQGINVFRHEHGSTWGTTPLVDVPIRSPGKLVDSLERLTPGRNRVRSYLDVVVPDNAPWSNIETELLQALAREPVQRLPWTSVSESRFFALYMDPELSASWQRELAALVHAIRVLLRPQAA